ncbi:MAG: hypothetical protein MJ086_00090 [Lachnospiraceae bacterium]|nr:hypothetical protein [Lachnospiraceae bacterium]
MKKRITLILAAILVCVMAFAMTACGGGSNGGGSNGGGSKGTTLDVGDFTVEVPSGWKSFESTDMFGEQDAEGNYPVKTDQIYLVKGGKSEFDVFSKPCVTVTYYANETVESQTTGLSWFVDEMTEKEFSAQGIECTAIETKTESFLEEGTFDTAYYIYMPLSEGGLFSANFSGEELNLEDAGVKTIMESLTLK